MGEQLAASEIAKRLRVQVNSGCFIKAISQLLNEGLITYCISKSSFFYLTSPLIPLPRKIRGLRQKRRKGKFFEMPLHLARHTQKPFTAIYPH